jgi:protein-tyrosine phosphatase
MSAPDSAIPPLNFRDVGGLSTSSGLRTRRNVLYRSDALYVSDDPSRLGETWPPAAVVDLRRDEERTEFDMGWPDSTQVHRFGFLDPAVTGRSRSLAELYRGLLSASAEAIAQIISIAARAQGPVLVHCAAGKDRTGIVTAAGLRAAGVTRDAVVTDYLATGSSARQRRERVAAFGIEYRHPAVPDEFFDVSADAINAILDILHGGADGDAADTAAKRWLMQRGADRHDIAAWSTRLVGG